MDDSKRIILAVDDVSINLTILKGILASEYDVRVAKSGNMALTILGRLSVDLVLLDIEMPEMSGFDFLNILRGTPEISELPVICITASAGEQTTEKATEYGVRHVLERPIDAEELKSRIRDILN